jgi:hypothetical protein
MHQYHTRQEVLLVGWDGWMVESVPYHFLDLAHVVWNQNIATGQSQVENVV